MENNIKGALISKLQILEDYALALEQEYANEINEAHPNFKESAKNLIHYIALRQNDLRDLQNQLVSLGLSSLGRSESHVVSSLRLISDVLKKEIEPSNSPSDNSQVSIFQGFRSLHENTEALLGPASPGRIGRIMVTLPSQAADDYDMVYNVLASGMNAARINCAHDSQQQWSAMISNIKKAKKSLGAECKIIMDLAGPKIRTGKLAEGPKVLKWRAVKNEKGEIIKPASIWITSGGGPAPEHLTKQPDVILYMPKNWIGHLKKGDKIRFTDRRGKNRKLKIVGELKDGVWAESRKTAYLESGIVLERYRPKTKKVLSAVVSNLDALEIPIVLKEGDRLILRNDSLPGRPAILDESGQVIEPASVSCTHPQVFNDVKKGQPVFIDDGKIAGLIRSVHPKKMIIEITSAKPKGSKLRADKGINFPKSKIKLKGLTDKDLKDLDFIVKYADSVSMSFVNKPSDIAFLLNELKKRKAQHLGIIVKIETRRGFKNLPWILLRAMHNYPVGVMIARGDLAIECGWVRLAELQEEIMWFCEAAHIPVIWATQVLEGLVKSGLPSRAEITDAAMAQRAECVMLNKGPFILNAIKTLDDILKRMQNHQVKKHSKLRKLSVSTQSR